MSDEIGFDVHVLNPDGSPARGEKVTAFFDYSWIPGCVSHEHTDSDGHAAFSSPHPATPNSVEIHVRSEIFGPYDLEDGAGFTCELEEW